MKCKNCGKTIEENFCSHCSQSSKVGEISLSNFITELTESVFQINKGFFYTLKELLIRPGYSIKDFLDGKRIKHFKPFAYVLLLSTLYFLVSRLTGKSTWLNDIISGFSIGANDTKSGIAAPSILIWLSKNFAYASLILLPLFSFASYLSFFRMGRNYLEHIILNAYITGQQAIFYSVFLILKIFIISEYLEPISVLISISYTIWVFWQIFAKGNRMINILRSILTYVLYLVFGLGFLYAVNEIQQL